MIKIAICDDEKYMVDDLSLRVMDFFNDDKTKFEIHEFSSGLDFLKFYDVEGRCDIIFMDIEIGDENGIEIISRVRDIDDKVIVIFVTSHTSYVNSAFRLSAFQYINKPLDGEFFNYELNRAVTKVAGSLDDYSFSTKEGEIIIKINEIYDIEVDNCKTTLHTKVNSYVMTKRISLSHLIDELGVDKFCKCNQGQAINMSQLQLIQPENAVLKTGKKVYLSRKFKKDFLESCSKNKWRREL